MDTKKNAVDEEKIKYYSLDKILKKQCRYNLIIGERSNGKTYSVLNYALKRYCETGEQIGIIRRYMDDFVGKRGTVMFNGLVNNKLVEKYTKGQWTNVMYYSSRWFLTKFDEKTNKWVYAPEPMGYAFSLNGMEHDKSTAYPKITTILFDEFVTRKTYLDEEFVIFQNVVSTIVRQRDDVIIFMCANTVNKYCPYFVEMGLTNMRNMQHGDIDVYEYGDSGLRVAVEYTDTAVKSKKKSDVYFAFNNPKLNMITKGGWEIPSYPHLPKKYVWDDVAAIFFIKFYDEVVQGEVISQDNCRFIFLHRKTTPLRDNIQQVVYSQEYSPQPNYNRHIIKPTNNAEKIIWDLFRMDKVFYQDNEIGELVRNYVQWATTDKGIA